MEGAQRARQRARPTFDFPVLLCKLDVPTAAVQLRLATDTRGLHPTHPFFPTPPVLSREYLLNACAPVVRALFNVRRILLLPRAAAYAVYHYAVLSSASVRFFESTCFKIFSSRASVVAKKSVLPMQFKHLFTTRNIRIQHLVGKTDFFTVSILPIAFMMMAPYRMLKASSIPPTELN